MACESVGSRPLNLLWSIRRALLAPLLVLFVMVLSGGHRAEPQSQMARYGYQVLHAQGPSNSPVARLRSSEGLSVVEASTETRERTEAEPESGAGDGSDDATISSVAIQAAPLCVTSDRGPRGTSGLGADRVPGLLGTGSSSCRGPPLG